MSAPAAYRKDLAANGQPFGERDGDWITIASLASSAALGEEGSETAWAGAIDTAVQVFGAAELDRLAQYEWGTAWSDFDPLTLASIAMHEANARATSTVILDSVLRVRNGMQDLAYGRALAQRARNAYLSAEHELAADTYQRVDLIGRRINSIELRARAAQGVVGLAQWRGNHPQMLEAAARSLELAEQTRIPRVRSGARYSMMMSTAVFRRFDESLHHGWELFNIARGNQDAEAVALFALGQLFLDMGHVDAARSAFVTVLSRPLPAHRLLAALGSLATTSAFAPAERERLEWAVAEVERFRDTAVAPWAYASTLLDCALALRDIGDPARGMALRDEALAIAKARGFFALEFRAESMQFDATTVLPPRAPVTDAGTEIMRSVRRLGPRRLPRHVRMATANGVL